MSTETHTSNVRQKLFKTAQKIMGRKGFSAVGLNEILLEAGVPKGSFYHYFASKDAFGEALLERYFENYMASLDEVFEMPGLTAADCLMNYWKNWLEAQVNCDLQGNKCLAVKLGAEVSDLSETMRLVLQRGTTKIIKRLAVVVEAGIQDRSLPLKGDPYQIAETLYQLWLGASLLEKITRDAKPLEAALMATQRFLKLYEVGKDI